MSDYQLSLAMLAVVVVCNIVLYGTIADVKHLFCGNTRRQMAKFNNFQPLVQARSFRHFFGGADESETIKKVRVVYILLILICI